MKAKGNAKWKIEITLVVLIDHNVHSVQAATEIVRVQTLHVLLKILDLAHAQGHLQEILIRVAQTLIVHVVLVTATVNHAEAIAHRVVGARVLGVDSRRALDDLGAVGAQDILLVLRHLVGAHEDALVSALLRDDREAHARVSARRLDDGAPGADEAITLGGTTLANLDGQEDIANPSSPVCSCGVNPVIGLSIGFWEPARHVEVVRKPFCLASLGGIDLDPGIPAPAAARFTRPEGDGDGGSFYQAHFYVNPVLYWLEVVTDFPCLERGSFDLAYLTEVDPLWNDDELTLILNPEAVLFANPVAVAACAADCVAAALEGEPVPALCIVADGRLPVPQN